MHKYPKYLSIITWWRDVRGKQSSVPSSEFDRELSHVTYDTMTWIKAGKVPWWECLSILHICANLKHYEPRLVALLSAELVKGKTHNMADLDSTQIAKLIYSLGVLKGLSNRRDRMDGDEESVLKLVFVEAMASAVHRKGLEKVNTFGLANIVYGAGKWGWTFSKSAPSTFRTLAYECIQVGNVNVYSHKLNPHDELCILFGSLLWLPFVSMGNMLRTGNTPILLECLQADRLESYTEQGLATVVYSLGIMDTDKTAIMVPLVVESCRRKRLEAFTEQQFSTIVYGLGLVGFDKHAKLLPLVEASMQTENLKRFKAQGLCNFLHGLAKMHFKNDKLFLPMLYESISRSKAGQLSPFQAASFMQSAGCLVNPQHGVVDELVDSVADSSVLQRMTARSLANVACAFSKLKVCNLEAWARVHDSISHVIKGHQTNATELGAICWAVGQSRVFNSNLLEELLNLLIEAPQKPSKTLLKAVTQALYSCRQFSFVNREFLEFVKVSVIESGIALSDWDIIDYAWTLCVLDALSMKEFKSLCSKLQRVPSVDPPDVVKGATSFSGMVAAIDTYMRCRYSKTGEELLQKLGFWERRHHEIQQARVKQPPNVRPSKIRLEVHDMLVKMGCCCELDVLIENYFVDFRVNGDSGYLIVVADQPDCFHDIVLGKQGLLGPVLFQLNIFRALKYKVGTGYTPSNCLRRLHKNLVIHNVVQCRLWWMSLFVV